MDDEEQIWDVVLAVLAGATLISVVAAITQAFGFAPVGGLRQRLELSAQTANVVLAFLALSTIGLDRWLTLRFGTRTRLRRWAVWMSVATAAAVIVGAVYSIWDALTVTLGSADLPTGGSGWATRVSTILNRAAAIAVAGVAVLLARRPEVLAFGPRGRPAATRRAHRAHVPLRTRDWPDPWESDPSTSPDE